MPSSRPGTSVCVVGAGVLGLSTAVHLARSGAEVVVVDAGGPAHGTTTAGAGFVAAFAADHNRRFAPAMVDVARYSLDFYAELHRSGADIEYSANGNVVLATTDPTMDAARRGLLGHPRRLPGTREVGPDEVAELTGGVVDPGAVVGGVLMAEGAQVTTGKVCLALVEELRSAGAELLLERTVTGVRREAGRVTGVETSRGVVEADTVVLACGAWTNALLRPLGWSLPMVPVVATRFVTDDVGLPATMPSVQCLDLGLWLRELRGAFSWGTSRGYRGLDALRREGVDVPPGRPRVAALERSLRDHQAAVAQVFPRLADQEPRLVVQGMPTYTADGNFFVGQVPTAPGVWTVTGDNESGVSHGPGMGRLLAQLVRGEEPYADPSPMRLDRYSATEFPDDASVIAHFADDRIGSVFA